jgi:hypothetical protein
MPAHLRTEPMTDEQRRAVAVAYVKCHPPPSC